MAIDNRDEVQANPTFSVPLAVLWGAGSVTFASVGIVVLRLLLLPPHHPILNVALGLGMLGMLVFAGWSLCRAAVHSQRLVQQAVFWAKCSRYLLWGGLLPLAIASACILFLKHHL